MNATANTNQRLTIILLVLLILLLILLVIGVILVFVMMSGMMNACTDMIQNFQSS